MYISSFIFPVLCQSLSTHEQCPCLNIMNGNGLNLVFHCLCSFC